MDELRTLLQRFLRVEGVTEAAVADRDGAVIESIGSNGSSTRAFRRLPARCIGQARALAKEVGCGPVRQATIELEQGTIVAEPVGELGVLMVSGHDGSSIGGIRLTARRDREAIESAVREHVSAAGSRRSPRSARDVDVLDCHAPSDVERAAAMIAQGQVVIFPVCGVMGFICDGTNPAAIDKIFRLKGRPKDQSLITAASSATRSRLTDTTLLPGSWTTDSIDGIYDFPVLVIVPAAPLSPRVVQPDPVDANVPTVAIWWGNFYAPMADLESALQQLNPDAFIAGTSCNISGQPSITSREDATSVFGRNRLVSAIMKDADFDEGRCLFRGSHTMLRIAGDDVIAHRPGSTHSDSLRTVLGDKLRLPDGFSDVGDATIVDVATLRTRREYLK